MDHSSERKFLHDLATPISICKLTLKVVREEIEKVMDRLGKIEKALESIENLHADHKAEITSNHKHASND